MDNYIVGLGEILFDCLPEGKKLGGAPANFAYHVSRFNLDSIAISAIGKDKDGALVKEELQSRGLKYHLAELDYPTGTVKVTLSGNGIPRNNRQECQRGVLRLPCPAQCRDTGHCTKLP